MQDSGINVFFQGINSLLLLKGLWTTLHISLLSAGLSIPLGILLGIFMTLKNPIARVVSRICLEIVRIMPQLVLLFVVYFGFTRAFGWNLSAYWSAIIVFTFWGTGEMGDLVRGALISIPKTQYESAQVLGLSKLQTMRLVVLPQAVRQLIPPSINLITRMIKTTSLVVLIGIVEVLKTGQQIIDANRFEYPTAALWVYGAIIVFTFWGTGEMGDLVRGALISIPKTQYESAQVLGLSKLQTMRLVVLPQAVRQLIPPSINLITRMIKTTSLVVLIGIVEVLKTGQQIIDANRFEYPTAALWVYGAVFLLYFLACWPVSLAAKALEKKWKA